MKVLVVYKKTAYERWHAEDDPRIRALIAAGDRAVASLERAHANHHRALEEAEAAFAERGVETVFRHEHHEPADGFDMVFTLGGDGTLLWASHTVGKGTPMVAINSDPEHSVGYFCAGDRHNVGETIDAALEQRLRPTKLTRMEVRIDERVAHTRVLNDVLFCHDCPAATTRFLIRFGEVEESHACSGIWVGPAAGSTAAQRSAGGKVLPIGSKKLQWVVRELYRPRGASMELAKGLIPDGEELLVKTQIREGRIYFDGAQKVAEVDVGSEIVLRRSAEPLTLLGLRSRGR